MKLYVVICMKKGINNSLDIEAVAVFRSKADALARAIELNETSTCDWAFVSDVELPDDK